jgi:hypothetical protein
MIMNMAYNSYGSQDQDPEYQAEFQPIGGNKKTVRPRAVNHSRSKNRPASFNGIHRRRNKRFSW